MEFFDNVINLLKSDGINSKKKVTELLLNLTEFDLIKIRREITEELNIRRRNKKSI